MENKFLQYIEQKNRINNFSYAFRNFIGTREENQWGIIPTCSWSTFTDASVMYWWRHNISDFQATTHHLKPNSLIILKAPLKLKILFIWLNLSKLKQQYKLGINNSVMFLRHRTIEGILCVYTLLLISRHKKEKRNQRLRRRKTKKRNKTFAASSRLPLSLSFLSRAYMVKYGTLCALCIGWALRYNTSMYSEFE